VARKRTHLKTLGHVLTELGRQYRRADAGELDWPDAACAARILREMRQVIEGDGFEQRIAALEDALGKQPGRPNGGARQWSARP
jgi:hypothetical protein